MFYGIYIQGEIVTICTTRKDAESYIQNHKESQPYMTFDYGIKESKSRINFDLELESLAHQSF